MGYVALYRAYRPQSFKEVAGQKHIVQTLQNAIKLNKVAHAYLFTGPRGTGKTTLAKIFAKALNCESGPSIEPCNSCEICKGITKGTIADVIEIDAASNNGVDEIRDLRDKVKYLPASCRYKVYIIDEVHMLSQGAFNALLKTLEEPPKYVVFILATTEPHKIPLTILSRCQRFDFQAISKDEIIKRLKEVIDSEKLNVSGDALDLIADACEGGMRDALSLLDQAISYSADDLISLDDVLAVSGNISKEKLLKILIDSLDGASPLVLEDLDEMLKDGKEVPRIINDLILFLRDSLLYKAGSKEQNKAIFESPLYQNFITRIPNQIIYHWLNLLNEALYNIRFTNQKRTFLELALLKMADTTLNDYELITRRVDDLENKFNELMNKKTEIFNSNPYENINQGVIKNVEINKEDYINIKDIEDVLNNGSKENKLRLNNILLKINEEFHDEAIFNILHSAQIGAVSHDKAILILQNEATANRFMIEPNYTKILNELNRENKIIDEFYTLPIFAWNKILEDYKKQYKSGILKPELNEVEIKVKKHIIEIDSKKDDIQDYVKDMFEGVTIEEEK